MDNSITTDSERHNDFRGAVIVYANWFQFGPGEINTKPCVESRMLLWCVDGAGYLEVNGKKFPFLAGDWILLPWKHKLVYRADSDRPFRVGGVHVIPWHDRSHAVDFRVAHDTGDPLAGKPWRRDARWPMFAKTVQGYGEMDALKHLGAYVIEKCQSPSRNAKLMRTLAQLLLEELVAAVLAERARDRPVPATLRRIQDYVRLHPGEKISIPVMAKIGGCSTAGVYRAFRNHTEGCSPSQWVAQWKTEQAARLLRTTTLSVQEVGRTVGMTDPFHFSRFFKKMSGESPRRYRLHRQLI